MPLATCAPDEYAMSPTRSRPPTDGRCQLCQYYVGTMGLVWHHCHDCGAELGWLCNNCNVPLTEHLLHVWDKADVFVRRHECPPALFDTPRTPTPAVQRSEHTRRLFLSNGGGDARWVSVSTHPDLLTVEQLAVIAGVNANTMRDLFNGRANTRIGHKVGKTYFITKKEALEYLRDRWELE